MLVLDKLPSVPATDQGSGSRGYSRAVARFIFLVCAFTFIRENIGLSAFKTIVAFDVLSVVFESLHRKSRDFALVVY